MPIETLKLDGRMSVCVPKGTQIYPDKEVLVAFHNEGLEGLTELADRRGENIGSVEEALLRLERTMEVHPDGIFGVLSALDIGLRPSSSFRNHSLI